MFLKFWTIKNYCDFKVWSCLVKITLTVRNKWSFYRFLQYVLLSKNNMFKWIYNNYPCILAFVPHPLPIRISLLYSECLPLLLRYFIKRIVCNLIKCCKLWNVDLFKTKIIALNKKVLWFSTTKEPLWNNNTHTQILKVIF